MVGRVEVAGLLGAYGDLMGDFRFSVTKNMHPPVEGSGWQPQSCGYIGWHMSPNTYPVPKEHVLTEIPSAQLERCKRVSFSSSPMSELAAAGLPLKPDGPTLHL